MRRAILASMGILVLGSAMTWSMPKKNLPADVGAGRIAWFDISTTNLAQAKEFYGKLFGWQFNPVQGSDQAAEIVAGGTPIGTIRGAEGAISAFNGVVYVQVNDIQASCKKAADLGAKVVPGFPFNLPGPHRSHRPVHGSLRPSDGHVLENAASARAGDGKMTSYLGACDSATPPLRSSFKTRSP